MLKPQGKLNPHLWGGHPPIAMEQQTEELATPPLLPSPLPYVKLQFVQPPAEYIYPALVGENKVIYTRVNFTATAALTESPSHWRQLWPPIQIEPDHFVEVSLFLSLWYYVYIVSQLHFLPTRNIEFHAVWQVQDRAKSHAQETLTQYHIMFHAAETLLWYL